MAFPRELSPKFIKDLSTEQGVLADIPKRVKDDDTLLFALRGKYINIYYRGGNLMKIESNGSKGNYKATFDNNYIKDPAVKLPELPESLKDKSDVKVWIDAFPTLKQIMDYFFTKHSKLEREFQQLVARENNCSTISNETEYFVTDIEFADTGVGARFDILATRWLANERKDGSKCRAALIEMKYGDQALDGKAGLVEHLKDIDVFLRDEVKYKNLLGTMSSQFNQLAELGMIKFNRSIKVNEITLSDEKPEVIFLLANHNPRSTKLNTILKDEELDKYANSENFDLRFFVASFAGYGLHSDCLLKLDEMRCWLIRVSLNKSISYKLI